MNGFTRTLIVVVALGAAGCGGARVRGRATIVAPRPPTARLEVRTAPPPRPAHVVVTAPAQPPMQGAIWVEGHQEWDGRGYVWIDGYWLEPQPDCRFTQPSWERRGGSWVYDPGGCRGRDGVVVVPPRPG
ncbi:MAG: hypothetical protein M3Y87_10180, partial [Myxococcota bacterium]|nr:hypothetical protein [Myxococcota bacterium]